MNDANAQLSRLSDRDIEVFGGLEPLKDYDELLTVRDMAGLFKVSEHTIYVWNATGVLPSHFKVGHRDYYRKYDVLRLLGYL